MSYHKQTAEFIATVAQNMPEMSGDIMQGWIENPKALQKLLSGLCLSVNGSSAAVNPDWKKVYETLGMLTEYDFEIANLVISEQDGLWTIPVIKGVTCNKAVAGLKGMGVRVWTYKDDLDKDVTVNGRDPNRDGSYVVSFHNNVEADEENKDQSANQRREQGCKDITLLERMLLDLGYFLKTGKHLDIKNWTLCSGSRCSGGFVPCAHWGSGSFEVGWDHSDNRLGSLRARSVVSCQPKPERA